MCGTARVKHSTFRFTIVSFLLAVYSPPGRLLKRKSCVLFQFHLLSLSRWSPHLPQCQSTSVSLALVSTLATVSVHFCLCRLGLHTCHSVSPLLSLSPWSSHLPQCQPTASSRFSVTVRVVIPTAPQNESIVNGYRRHNHNYCSHRLPQGLNSNPQVNTCLQSLQQLPLGLRCPK